jgi:hypothetical protein
VGRLQIECFYDTFIGPRDITFHRDLDIVAGMTVIRDLDLEVALSAAQSMTIPAVLRYDLTPATHCRSRSYAHIGIFRP